MDISKMMAELFDRCMNDKTMTDEKMAQLKAESSDALYDRLCGIALPNILDHPRFMEFCIVAVTMRDRAEKGEE